MKKRRARGGGGGGGGVLSSWPKEKKDPSNVYKKFRTNPWPDKKGGREVRSLNRPEDIREQKRRSLIFEGTRKEKPFSQHHLFHRGKDKKKGERKLFALKEGRKKRELYHKISF